MDPGRWQTIKSILADALELTEPALRAAYIEQACAGDADLRSEVDSFLAEDAGGLERFAAGAETLLEEESRKTNVGRRLGAYELVRELGRGGMGTVWLARRADNRFEQEVAIKLLKRGTDTEEVLARFRAERRILARLEHPGIARLLDAGETDDGLPFFVMEYIADGERLTTFVKERALSLAARVELFRKVCDAVQFAHQNLVVHRDLKPGNILVTAAGEPKLLDFGIARLLETNDDGTGDAPQVTAMPSRHFTAAYASPEQVRGEPITTSSDIYTLGALLFELLAEQPPHRFTSSQPSQAELLRVIGGEGNQPRLSVAADNPETRRRLRGDLETIVARAMAREPARRYQSASGLANDLGRYVAGRTVRARPDTFRYRVSKFFSRNKTGVTIAAVFAVALLGGISATVWEAHVARRRFQDVRRLTNSYLFEIHDAIRDLPGSTPARHLIVNRALEYLDRLVRESGGERALQLELGNAYVKVGDVQGKPYTANLGDSAGALRSYTKAAAIARPFALAERQHSIAARRLLSQALESCGVVQSRLHLSAAATQSHGEALGIREKLSQSDPAHAEEWERGMVANHVGLGDAIVSRNRNAPTAGFQRLALRHYRQALAVSEKLMAAHPASAVNEFCLAKAAARVAIELSELGAIDHDPAAFGEAAALHLRTIALDEAAASREPTNTTVRRTLEDELVAFGYLQTFSGVNLDGGLDACRRAEAIAQSLTASDPANAEARQDLSTVYYVTARLWQKKGNVNAATEAYRSCLRILEPLVTEHPDNVETAFDFKRVQEGLAEMSRQR